VGTDGAVLATVSTGFLSRLPAIHFSARTPRPYSRRAIHRNGVCSQWTPTENTDNAAIAIAPQITTATATGNAAEVTLSPNPPVPDLPSTSPAPGSPDLCSPLQPRAVTVAQRHCSPARITPAIVRNVTLRSIAASSAPISNPPPGFSAISPCLCAWSPRTSPTTVRCFTPA